MHTPDPRDLHRPATAPAAGVSTFRTTTIIKKG